MKEIIENSESDDEIYSVEEILDHQTTEVIKFNLSLVYLLIFIERN
jgi:hypothetical protein